MLNSLLFRLNLSFFTKTQSTMKAIHLTIALTLAVLNGCGDQDPSVNKPAPAVFTSQQQALEKAKQVEGIIQDRDLEQREVIDRQAQ